VVRDVTDRRVAEDALRKSRTMFELLFERSPDATFVMDEIGKVDRVNTSAEVMFGLSREGWLGQSIAMLLPHRFPHRHLPHRAGYMSDAKLRPMGTGLPLSARRADGSEFPVDIMLSPIEIQHGRLALAGVRDVTERSGSEEALRKSRTMFELLFERAPDAIFV